MTETIQKKKRDVSLDVAKGILIFLVVWGHSIHYGFGYEYSESYAGMKDIVVRAICTFHMPLFMAISGYLFYYSNKKPFWDVVFSRLRSIGIPYFVYCTVLLCFFTLISILKGMFSLSVFGVYVNTYWFLTSVMLNCVVVCFITAISRSRWFVTLALLLINLGNLFVTDEYLYNTHNYMFTCFTVGYLYNLHFNRPITFKNFSLQWGGIAIICFSICVSLFKDDLYIYFNGVYLIRDGKFSMHQLGIDCTRFTISLITSICFLYFIPLCKCVGIQMRSVLCALGRYSLGIYCFSTIIFVILYKIMGLFDINIPHNYVSPLILALIVSALSYYFMIICSKYKLLTLLFLGGR